MNSSVSIMQPRQERRQSLRQRALLAGVLVEPNKSSTWSCTIRNISEGGARLGIADANWVPLAFGIEIAARDMVRQAEVVWRTPDTIGVKFKVAPAEETRSLSMLNKLRHERELLQRRISQLSD